MLLEDSNTTTGAITTSRPSPALCSQGHLQAAITWLSKGTALHLPLPLPPSPKLLTQGQELLSDYPEAGAASCKKARTAWAVKPPLHPLTCSPPSTYQQWNPCTCSFSRGREATGPGLPFALPQHGRVRLQPPYHALSRLPFPAALTSSRSCPREDGGPRLRPCPGRCCRPATCPAASCCPPSSAGTCCPATAQAGRNTRSSASLGSRSENLNCHSAFLPFFFSFNAINSLTSGRKNFRRDNYCTGVFKWRKSDISC